MGNIGSRLTRPLRTYNIESRTEKFLDKPKPRPAPTFPSVGKQMDLAKKISPDFMETHNKKDPALGDRLKEVFVTSEGPPDENIESTKRKPMSREQFKILEYGVYEPPVVPAGKCTLKQAVRFLHDHKVDPVKHTAEEIARSYNLNVEVAANIIKHYRVLYMKMPAPITKGLVEAEVPLLMSEFMQVTSKEFVESTDGLKKLANNAEKGKK